ncbi:MAG: histidine kinase N-terminal 7TM domain-containing protein [Candidatus Paceibacterota bacterium]|jgi:hypothetical protein
MTYFAFSGLFNCIAGLLIGFLIFMKDRKKENRLFSYWTFSIAFWSFGYYFWQISTSAESALFWCKFLMIGATFIPVTYLHFTINFLKLPDKNKPLLYFSYALAIFFLAISFATDWFVKGVEARLFFDFWPIPGILYPLFLALFFGLLVYCWILMFATLRKTQSNMEKTQIKYLLGTIPAYFGGSMNFPLWYGIPLAPWGNILVSLCIILTAIGLIKYRLFDIKTILTEGLVATMGIVLMVLPFLMPDQWLKYLTSGIFLFYCVIGYLLIRSTNKELETKEHLEERVAERTQELENSKKVAEERATELEKWYNLTIGRELRMAELKKKIGELEDKKIN